MFEKHKFSKNFIRLHKIFLKIDSKCNSMIDYFISLTTKKIMKMIDISDSFEKTAFVWIVEYEFTTFIKFFLTFEVNSNQFRYNKNGDFSPFIHFAIVEFRSAWMNANIVENVRFFVETDADLNIKNHENWIFLHIAAFWNFFFITNMLQQCDKDFLNWQTRTNTNENIFEICDNIKYLNKYKNMLKKFYLIN